MTDRLDGARAKVERAKEQIQEFNTVIRNSIDSFYGIRCEERDDSINFRAVVRGGLPIKWSIIAGEIAHNLRSALDHVVWQLVDEKGTARTEFPIFDSSEKYETTGKKKIQLVSASAQEIIEGLQPYHKGMEFSAHPLYRLHHINRIDKHRSLHLLGIAVSKAAIGIGGSGTLHSLIIHNPKPTFPLEHDAVLRTVHAAAGTSRVKVSHEFSFEIAFGKFEVCEGLHVIPTLRQIADFVGEKIELFKDHVSGPPAK